MNRITRDVLIVLLASTHMGTVGIRITLPEEPPTNTKQVLASVENNGREAITICVEVGQRSPLREGELQATPTPFWVQQYSRRRWQTLITGPDIGSTLQPVVIEPGKAAPFPFRLSTKGTMRLMLKYWAGSLPNMDCRAEPKGAKQISSPTFTID